jgi:hypothetical protein
LEKFAPKLELGSKRDKLELGSKRDKLELGEQA